MSLRLRKASLYSGQLVTLYFGLVNLWRRFSACLYGTCYLCGWNRPVSCLLGQMATDFRFMQQRPVSLGERSRCQLGADSQGER